MTNPMRTQLPTNEQAALLIDAKLITKCDHRNGMRWDCNIKAERRVCRNRHNGNRSETKDSRNMADHIFRQHRDDPRVAAVAAKANTMYGVTR